MEQITKLVAEKTGMNETMARLAVDTVIGFLKERLPAPARGLLDTALAQGAGGAAGAAVPSGLDGLLGGLLKK